MTRKLATGRSPQAEATPAAETPGSRLTRFHDARQPVSKRRRGRADRSRRGVPASCSTRNPDTSSIRRTRRRESPEPVSWPLSGSNGYGNAGLMLQAEPR